MAELQLVRQLTELTRRVDDLVKPEVATSGGGPFVQAAYVVMALHADLTGERVLTAGTGITVTDGGAGGNATVAASLAVPTITLGAAAAAGVATTLVRSDCTIAAFDVTVPTTIQCDDAAAVGTAAFAARRDHKHAIVCDTPANIGVANAEGTATSFARSDHVHNHPSGLGANLHHAQSHVIATTAGLGADHTTSGLTAGQVLRATAATTAAFQSLVAGDIPALGGTPALTFTTANAAGTASTYVRTDASLAIFDTTVPSTIQCDDAAAVGTAAFAARRDHKHAIVCDAPTTNLSVSTTNAEGSATSFARSDHSHAITSSADPGAAASILASTAAGLLTLVNLNLRATSNQIVFQSAGVTGTLTWTPATSAKVITLPNLTGTTALGAGTLTVATANSVTVADHTHAITSSSNPGAAASLLATNASGYLQLVGLGIGTAATAANRITIVDGGTIGQAAGPLLTFNDISNYLGITGCFIGAGTLTPAEMVHVNGRLFIDSTTEPADTTYRLWNSLGTLFWGKTDLSTALTAITHISASTAAGQSIPDNIDTIVIFNTEVYDTLGEYNPVTGVFTASAAGYYHVHARILFVATTAWAAIERASLNIYVDGIYVRCLCRETDHTAANIAVELQGGTTLYLAAGQTLDVRVNQNTGGALALYSDATHNWLTIDKLIHN